MTSRQRIRLAIDHREPDRVPVDFGSMGASGIQAVAYNRLKAHLGDTTGPTRVFDVMLQLAEPEDWILERFSSDAINGGRDFAPAEWKDWTLADNSPCRIPSWVRIERRRNEQIILNEDHA